MRFRHYIYIIPLCLLASCDKHEGPDPAELEDAYQPIVLNAGTSASSVSALTKADPTYVSLSTGIKMRLQVTGTWLGHSPVAVVNEALATIGTASTADITDNDDVVITSGSGAPVNAVNYVTDPTDETLYWNDYGMADPANMPPHSGNGRDAGLTIYGVAVNDATADAPTVTTWNAHPWTLGTSGNWSNKDIITSHNIKNGGLTGTYLFDKRAAGKTLIFTHAMSKFTVNLTANDGFFNLATETAADAKFVSQPTAVLKDFVKNGTVDITSDAVTPSTSPSDVADIATYFSGTWSTNKTATLTGLVYPHRTLDKTDNILVISADGNNYNVTATKIVEAINGSSSPTTGEILPGKNYILNITVNKTDIEVTATVADWIDVSAEMETPLINIDTPYGQEGTALTQNFSFFLSEDNDSGYGTSAGGGTYYDANSTYTYSLVGSEHTYTPSVRLYWPDHSTAYFFRGIYPVIKGATSNDAPQVVLSDSKQVVNVANEAYNSSTFPSNFMLGMPRKADGTDVGAITATEGDIRMNFQYAMSHVTVVVQSVESSPATITFGSGSKVEIVNGYTSGSINLSDGSSNMGTPGTYEMSRGAIADNKFTCSDIILPQLLVDGSRILRFRITADNGGQTDSYETVLGIGSIPVDLDGAGPSPAETITEWLPGYHYTYTLTITKTDIVVTATLTDWVEALASTEVWF